LDAVLKGVRRICLTSALGSALRADERWEEAKRIMLQVSCESKDFLRNSLQFRQWGRVTGKDQRGEDGNELAKGVECGD